MAIGAGWLLSSAHKMSGADRGSHLGPWSVVAMVTGSFGRLQTVGR